MGSSTSRLVEEEKASWSKSHSLDFDQVLKTECCKLVDNFKEDLKLCFEKRTMLDYVYQHWFITDGFWVLEFGSGDALDNNVVIYCMLRKDYIVAEEFPLNSEVKMRMKKVCGATNYSLALRNCEHVAHYVQSGVWVSFQMAKGSGMLFKIFEYYMEANKRRINTFPEELKPVEPEPTRIHKEYEPAFKYKKHKDTLEEADNDAYNIIFIGPTGCGKSSLINNLFNQTVVRAAASAYSVTRQVDFIGGIIEEEGNKESKKVNIIDTLGFCDSVFTASQVLDMIQTSLHLNLAKIDKVMIVCYGRIEHQHAEAVKQFMKWLQYKSYKERFCFIYNKADLLTEGEKVTNLLAMCEMLEADTDETIIVNVNNQQILMKKNLALGFPPNSSYKEVKYDLWKLAKAAQGEIPNYPRIPLARSSCTIL